MQHLPAGILPVSSTVAQSVVKTVSKSIDRSGAAEVKKRLNGLDQALEVLKGPKVVSTIAKSSNDWENYKEQEGLEDDLAKAAKDGLVS